MAKPHKVEEPAGTYSVSPKPRKVRAPRVKSSEPSAVRRVEDDAFRIAADKVFKTHHELLRRLAQ